MAKFCGSCGKPVKPGSKFCGSCGKPITHTTTSGDNPQTADAGAMQSKQNVKQAFAEIKTRLQNGENPEDFLRTGPLAKAVVGVMGKEKAKAFYAKLLKGYAGLQKGVNEDFEKRLDLALLVDSYVS